ncbi:MAG TPA: substrate-binding domain-containing protein [Fimbriimonas sp.]
MKRTVAWLLMGAALAFGCSTPPEGDTGDKGSGVAGDKKLQIAVIPKGATHEFWKSVHEGAQKAADETGVQIVWKGPIKEDDRESQVKTVEDFINQKVDGIVLAPLDDTALRGPVEEAKRNEIPTVIIDSGLKDADYVSFVATDNYKGGQMAGAEMIKLMADLGKPKARIVMLRYQEGSASTMEREKGFLDMVKNEPKIEVVSSNQYGGATTETAQKAGENLLAPLKKPDGSLDIDGIYTPNESTTFGMLRVLQDNNWAGKVKFIGFDASPKLIEGLTNGHINGLILQNPRKMGELGVKTIVDYLKGNKDVEKRIDTGATLITKENMDSTENKALLAPPKV